MCSACLCVQRTWWCCRSSPEKLSESTSNRFLAAEFLLVSPDLSRLRVEAGLRPCPIAESQLLRFRRFLIGDKLILFRGWRCCPCWVCLPCDSPVIVMAAVACPWVQMCLFPHNRTRNFRQCNSTPLCKGTAQQRTKSFLNRCLWIDSSCAPMRCADCQVLRAVLQPAHACKMEPGAGSCRGMAFLVHKNSPTVFHPDCAAFVFWGITFRRRVIFSDPHFSDLL